MKGYRINKTCINKHPNIFWKDYIFIFFLQFSIFFNFFGISNIKFFVGKSKSIQLPYKLLQSIQRTWFRKRLSCFKSFSLSSLVFIIRNCKSGFYETTSTSNRMLEKFVHFSIAYQFYFSVRQFHHYFICKSWNTKEMFDINFKMAINNIWIH